MLQREERLVRRVFIAKLTETGKLRGASRIPVPT